MAGVRRNNNSKSQPKVVDCTPVQTPAVQPSCIHTLHTQAGTHIHTHTRARARARAGIHAHLLLEVEQLCCQPVDLVLARGLARWLAGCRHWLADAGQTLAVQQSLDGAVPSLRFAVYRDCTNPNPEPDAVGGGAGVGGED